jgi:hypothetical protein
MHDPFLNKVFPRRQPEPPYRPAPFYRHPFLTLVLFIVGAMLLAGILASRCSGQAVGPITADCSPKCSGSYQIQNQSLVPMQFTVETFTLHFSKTGPIRSALESSVSVRLSQSSGRLGPKEVRRIDYQIRCAVLPCVVQFENAFSAGHTANGIAVKIALSHTVYVDSKAKDARKRILTAARLFK